MVSYSSDQAAGAPTPTPRHSTVFDTSQTFLTARLLGLNADPDQETPWGTTCLTHAAGGNSCDLLAFLLAQRQQRCVGDGADGETSDGTASGRATACAFTIDHEGRSVLALCCAAIAALCLFLESSMFEAAFSSLRAGTARCMVHAP
jgi:hypothetical protein